MNNDIEQPRDYVVHVTRQPLETRYDRVKKWVAIVLIAIGVIVGSAALVFGVAPDVHAQISPDYVPACNLIDATHAFCPSALK